MTISTRLRRHSRALSAALLLALALVLAAAAPAAAQTSPADASVFPAAGPAGTRFSFIASGFKSRERVGVWLNTPDGRALAVGVEQLRRASRDGRVNWAWDAPQGSAGGTYQMVARGVTSGVERVLTFQIGDAAAQPTAPAGAERANVYPGEGRAGSLFLFYAAGYQEGEQVSLWVNRPDGRAEAVAEESLDRLDRQGGRLDIAWRASLDAPAGRWELVIVGRESGVQNVIPFVLR